MKLSRRSPDIFEHSRRVALYVPESQRAQLTVVNVLGEIVRILVDGFVESGRHELMFDAPDLPSGMYFYASRLFAVGTSTVEWNAAGLGYGLYFGRLSSEGHFATIPLIVQ